MPMPPNTLRTIKVYSNALDYAPPPGFPARWAPGTGPRRTNFSHNFHGPLWSPTAMARQIRRPAKLSGLGDGDGLGDGILDSLSSVFAPAVASVVAPAEAQIADLKTAIKFVLVFSGIAAGTGLLNVLRR